MDVLTLNGFGLPWYLEEEGEITDLDSSEENGHTLEHLKAAVNAWTKANKPNGNYRFVLLLLNLEGSGFEKKLRDWCLAHPRVLGRESGANVLIFHPYTQKEGDDQRSVPHIVYGLQGGLGLKRTAMPQLFVMPGPAFPEKERDNNQTLALSLKDLARGWDGEDDDFFALFFRAVFDAADEIEVGQSKPLIHMEKRVKKKFHASRIRTLPEKAVTLLNMPFVNTLIKALL